MSPEQQLSLIDRYGGLEAWGTDATAPHYAAAWAWAGNAPFQWGKQVASHLGGTRNGMVISWPERIADAGRSAQPVHPLHRHRTDHPRSCRYPTATRWSTAPSRYRWTAPASPTPSTTPTPPNATRNSTSRSTATGPSTKTAGGRRAKLDRIPWDATPATIQRFAPGVYDPEGDRWELYYLPDDYSQARDLAADHPEKLAELKALFWQEAEANKVLPLMAGFSVFFGILPPMPTVTTMTFYGDVENIASGMIPRIYGHSYAIEAELHVPDGGAEGVIVAEADAMGGFSLWVDDRGLLHHTYSMMGVEQYHQVSTEPLPTGDITVGMQFDADAPQPRTGGDVTLYANQAKIGEGRIEKTVLLRFSAYAGMDIGRDNGLPVDPAYSAKSPYPFTGTVKKVIFDLQPKPHRAAKALHQDIHQAAVAGGHQRLTRGLGSDRPGQNRTSVGVRSSSSLTVLPPLDPDPPIRRQLSPAYPYSDPNNGSGLSGLCGYRGRVGAGQRPIRTLRTKTADHRDLRGDQPDPTGRHRRQPFAVAPERSSAAGQTGCREAVELIGTR